LPGNSALTEREIDSFKDSIMDNYRSAGRRFPWRESRDPYEIMVSEFMLQQTQTERVIPKYEAWLNRFPDIASVAEAGLAEVLSLWVGLGYNRRARYLRETCVALRDSHRSRIPDDPETLVLLPGIGPYTAAAITTFAYGRANAFIETNIRSVYLHFFFQGKKNVTDKEILELVRETLDRSNPREWYYALMDYGAELKRKFGNPNRSASGYARQAAFKGSNREARGAIIRYLGSASPASPQEIAKAESIETDRIRRALEGLVKEGLIAERGGRYGLP